MDFGTCELATRRLDLPWVALAEGTYPPSIHRNCPHNEVSSLLTRTLGPLPARVFEAPGARVERAYRALRRLAGRYPGTRWSHLKTAESYSGRLRRRYLEAERSLREDGPVERRDWVLRPFLKAEKVQCTDKKAKPRMIFPRSPRYNLDVASRLKPFEHWLWGVMTLKRLRLGTSKLRLVLKGCSPTQRANIIKRKMEMFADCVAFEVDGRAFEAHVGPIHLRREHAVYLTAYPRDGGLQSLLSRQMALKGKTESGVRFSREGGRASGDFNTGMGNSIIMLACVVGAMGVFGVPFDLAVDGDNALIFVRGADATRVRQGLGDEVLRTSGQELSIERPVTQLEGVRFGRSAPVLGPHGWTMVRDPRDVMSKAGGTHRYGRTSKGFLRYLRGVGECELSLARGIPVLQEFALAILRLTEGHKRLSDSAYEDYLVRGASFVRSDLPVGVPVSAETRRSFAAAFGWETDRQHLEERLCLEWAATRPLQGPDGQWWSADPGLAESWADRNEP